MMGGAGVMCVGKEKRWHGFGRSWCLHSYKRNIKEIEICEMN
jgi:hypothetical protein